MVVFVIACSANINCSVRRGGAEDFGKKREHLSALIFCEPHTDGARCRDVILLPVNSHEGKGPIISDHTSGVICAAIVAWQVLWGTNFEP